MVSGSLGKSYGDGMTVVEQGDVGDCMYIVQSGTLEVSVHGADGELTLSTLQAV